MYLQKARPCIRKHLITKADHSLVDCLCECADNILRGNVPLTKPQKEKLARNKAGLRALTKNRSLSKEESDLTERWIFGIPTRRRFPRRQVVVYGIDHQWQADLVDLAKLSSYNKGFKYLLTCIDVLSRYAWVVPLKDKTGKTLKDAFHVIFKSGRRPIRLQTDKGTEFTNRVFQKFLKEHDVHFFTTYNEETKASIVERFNRTLKTKMWKYFTHRETVTYVEVLSEMVASYNHTVHITIGIPPAEVTWANQTVSKRLYGRKGPKQSCKFSPGVRVRLSKAKRTFKKGYLPNWTEELFTVVKCIETRPPVYLVKDDHGEILEGTFYAEEIQKVIKQDDVYKIQSVLKKTTERKTSTVFSKVARISRVLQQLDL